MTLRVALNDDAVDELAETLTVTLAAGTGYTVGTTQSTHTLTITDDDVPEVEFAMAGSTVAEDAGGALTVTVNVSPAPVADLTVPVTVGGSAAITTDYTQSGLAGTPLALTVASGDTTATFTVTPVQDILAEGTEPITFTLGARTTGGVYMLGTQTGHTVELTDDDTGDDLPEVSFTAGTATSAESAGTATATVMVAPAPAAGESINVMVAVSGTAVLGTDYTLDSGAATTFTVSVDDTGMAAISITLTDDSTPENTEDLVLTVQPSLGVYTLLSPLSHRLSITDNDVPAVNFSAATSTVAEDALTASIMLTVAPTPISAFDVMVTGAAGAGLEVGEYTLPSSVRVMPGEATVTLRVALNDDAVDELAETLTVTLAAGTGYTVGTTQSTHTLTITDDDVPEVEFAMAGSTVAEDAVGALTVTVNVSPAPVADLTVPVTVGGSAMVTDDYTQSGLTGTTLTVSAAATTATFTVTPVDDVAEEGTESITFTLGARTTGGDYMLGVQTEHTVELTDDDTSTLPAVSFAAGTATAAEGDGSGTATVVTATVMVEPAPADSTSIDVMVAVSGTATLDTDYTLVSGTTTPFTVLVDDSGTAAISITLTDDSILEATEDLVLTVQASASAGVYTPSSPLTYRLSITDNDVPEAMFVDLDSEVSEGDTEALILVMLNAAAPADLTLMVTGVATGGLAGGEYTLPATLMITRGDDEATLRVGLTDDTEDENDETLTIAFTADAAYTVGAQGTHTLTITDDDVPEVEFAMTSSTLAEGAMALTVTVDVSPAPVTALAVPVTVSGTAVVGDDYTLASVGTIPYMLMIAENATTGTIILAAINDDDVEDLETVILTLGTGTGYGLGTDSVYTVTLTSEDTLPPQAEFTQADGGAIAESGGTAAPAITVSRPPAGVLTMMVEVSGTATLGTDYTLTVDGTAAVNSRSVWR